MTIDKAESKDGFDAVSDGRNVRWRGGSVAAKSTAKFEFTATIPSDTPLVIFEGEEFYGKFESGSFALSVPQYG